MFPPRLEFPREGIGASSPERERRGFRRETRLGCMRLVAQDSGFCITSPRFGNFHAKPRPNRARGIHGNYWSSFGWEFSGVWSRGGFCIFIRESQCKTSDGGRIPVTIDCGRDSDEEKSRRGGFRPNFEGKRDAKPEMPRQGSRRIFRDRSTALPRSPGLSGRSRASTSQLWETSERRPDDGGGPSHLVMEPAY